MSVSHETSEVINALHHQNHENHINANANDFFNEDLYDYQDTFLNRNGNQNQNNIKINNNGYNSNLYNPPEDAEYFDDDQNDFTVGPSTTNNINDDPEHMGGEYGHDIDGHDDDNLDGCNGAAMDSFFKRVDSCELAKPKKAKIINNYLLGDVLGDGSYGKVKECIDTRNLCRRAVKIINLKTVARKIPRGVQNVRREIDIMRRLDHKNVIKLYDTFEKGGQKTSSSDDQKSNFNKI
jgi:hypothetical protein